MAVVRASSTHTEEKKAPKDRSMKMLSPVDLGTAVVDLAGGDVICCEDARINSRTLQNFAPSKLYAITN
jgi:hypothetical protein